MFLALSLLLATAPPPLPGVDQFARFVGSWHCESAYGSHVSMDFSSGENGSIKLHTTFYQPSSGVRSGSNHVFVPSADGSWTTMQYALNGGLIFEGSGPGFDGDSATFTGTERVGKIDNPTREKLRLTSDTTLEHLWYSEDASGQWITTSYTKCTKV